MIEGEGRSKEREEGRMTNWKLGSWELLLESAFWIDKSIVLYWRRGPVPRRKKAMGQYGKKPLPIFSNGRCRLSLSLSGDISSTLVGFVGLWELPHLRHPGTRMRANASGRSSPVRRSISSISSHNPGGIPTLSTQSLSVGYHNISSIKGRKEGKGRTNANTNTCD
jgi:hypothetical protein